MKRDSADCLQNKLFQNNLQTAWQPWRSGKHEVTYLCQVKNQDLEWERNNKMLAS